jgi:hypothetical protein
MLVLVVAGAALAVAAQPATAFRDRDCADFKSHAQAQRFFEKHHPKSDPHRLDADHDGIACEDLRPLRRARVSLPERECTNVGPPHTDVGLYKIITRRIVCGEARAILRDWYHDPTQKDSGPAGWRCAEVKRGPFEIRSYCHRNGKQISFSRYLA